MDERRRSTKALANDEVIRSSAVNEIIRVGVDRLSLRDVGNLAGLTHGAAYARYEVVDELLADVWNSTLRDRLVSMSQLSQCAAKDPSASTVGELFEFIRCADARDRAAIEVLLVSRRIPALHEETKLFVRGYLEPSGSSPAESARAVVLFGLMMAQILADAQFGFDAEYQSALEKLMLEALGARAPDSRVGVDEIDRSPAPTSEPDRDRVSLDLDLKSKLARATCEVVGKSGFGLATISRIARRTNCSPGAIYKFHRSKEALVLGAFEGLMESARTASDLELMLGESHLAVLLNRAVSDEGEVRRDFMLEMALAAAHNDAMRSTVWGQLIESGVQSSALLERDDSRDQRLQYANRVIATVVLAVSWLATMAGSNTSFDMNSFAEPLRRGLVNQWFPDGVGS